MQYALMIVSGLVMNLVGPFRDRAAAKRWAEKEGLKEWTVVVLLGPGDVEQQPG